MSQSHLSVLFDSGIFSFQTHGGISRYYVELIKRLPLMGITPHLFAPLNFNAHLGALGLAGFSGIALPQKLRSRPLTKALSILMEATDYAMSRCGPFDLVHHTYYQRRSGAHKPNVTTVVDMIPEILPEAYPYGSPHAGKLNRVRESSLIIVISASTRDDLIRIAPESKNRIRVIPLAVDRDVFSRASTTPSNRGEYVLFVGQRDGYKNFRRFAFAMTAVLQSRPNLRLVCVGGGPFSAHERSFFHQRGLANRVEQCTVTDRSLPEYYQQALLFVYPSCYEGFGLPILEAFAAGCPVALSRASSFPEVAGNGGEYFDPRDVQSIEDAIKRILGNENLRQELVLRGRERLKFYSWNRTAKLTAEAYRSIS